MLPVTLVDATGIYAARDVFDALRERGVVVALAGRQTEWTRWSQERGIEPTSLSFPTLRQALRAYREATEAEPARTRPRE